MSFGDLDGSGYQAKLQHPLGVAFHYPSLHLYITDTFNNKLKRVDVRTGVCSSYSTMNADRRGIQRDETTVERFSEPHGLAIVEHWLFVADKNHSQVKIIDLEQETIARVSQLYVPHAEHRRWFPSSANSS